MDKEPDSRLFNFNPDNCSANSFRVVVIVPSLEFGFSEFRSDFVIRGTLLKSEFQVGPQFNMAVGTGSQCQ